MLAAISTQGMADLDVEKTQHCIANHQCVEGNPLMPSAHVDQLGINFALVGNAAISACPIVGQHARSDGLSDSARNPSDSREFNCQQILGGRVLLAYPFVGHIRPLY